VKFRSFGECCVNALSCLVTVDMAQTCDASCIRFVLYKDPFFPYLGGGLQCHGEYTEIIRLSSPNFPFSFLHFPFGTSSSWHLGRSRRNVLMSCHGGHVELSYKKVTHPVSVPFDIMVIFLHPGRRLQCHDGNWDILRLKPPNLSFSFPPFSFRKKIFMKLRSFWERCIYVLSRLVTWSCMVQKGDVSCISSVLYDSAEQTWRN
jgi:hypothetical protein